MIYKSCLYHLLLFPYQQQANFILTALFSPNDQYGRTELIKIYDDEGGYHLICRYSKYYLKK